MWTGTVTVSFEHRQVMHAEIANGKGEIAAICRRYRVSRLEVFGSSARGDDFDSETSDVDFHPPTAPGMFDTYFGLLDELRTVLGRPVDLLCSGRIRNRYLRDKINRSRELIHEA